MRPRRFSPQEKMEKRRLTLLLLAEKPYASKTLCLKLGLAPNQAGWFQFWHGKDRPLRLRLTIPQIEKLGLNVAGIEEVKSLDSRLCVFFHPSQKKLVNLLKPYETREVSRTPTVEGLNVEETIRSLSKNSQSAVQKELQNIKGIELRFHCPHCGGAIVLRGSTGDVADS